ncbi:MAG TPA: efflux RND transporter periplasmic adaptor subunit [Casimicrobiaceae bacterium]
MTKSALAIAATFAVLAAAAAGYWFGAQRQPAAPASQGPGGAPSKAAAPAAGTPMVVEATKVTLQALPQTITAVGSLRSDESITVRPEVAGRISDILFKEGERVAKGMTLVRLDPAINRAEVQQARANLQLAQSKYERAVDLSQRNFISGQAKDEAENNLRVAEAAVALADARLAKTEIKAPFSGIIGLRVVSVGDYVKEGADVVNLESIDPLKVDFRVPEVFMTQVQVGQALTVALDALPGRTFEGRVFAVNPLLDAAGRAVVIRAIVRNAETSLRPGMFARVRLITRDEKQALVIPEQAIVPQGDEQYVYRIVDGKVARVKVEIGQRRDAKVEVLKGLGPDDVVVTAGQLKLREGMPVTIANAAASASAVEPPAPRRKADGAPAPASKS